MSGQPILGPTAWPLGIEQPWNLERALLAGTTWMGEHRYKGPGRALVRPCTSGFRVDGESVGSRSPGVRWSAPTPLDFRRWGVNRH
jgi:hypothetical protein